MAGKKGLRTDALLQIETDEIYENTSDSIIKITESKARLIYKEYIDRPRMSDVFNNVGLFMAFAVPLVTADFKDFFISHC